MLLVLAAIKHHCSAGLTGVPHKRENCLCNGNLSLTFSLLNYLPIISSYSAILTEEQQYERSVCKDVASVIVIICIMHAQCIRM